MNLAYEAATADLNDVNMIDPFHLEAYGETTVNYNRDVEIFPVLNAMFQRIQGSSPYRSPTDMGVNMAGFAIVDDEACQEASRMEILRRYYACLLYTSHGHRRAAGVRGAGYPRSVLRRDRRQGVRGGAAFRLRHQYAGHLR